MLRITPVNVAVWSLGGFYLSLMPSLLRGDGHDFAFHRRDRRVGADFVAGDRDSGVSPRTGRDDLCCRILDPRAWGRADTARHRRCNSSASAIGNDRCRVRRLRLRIFRRAADHFAACGAGERAGLVRPSSSKAIWPSAFRAVLVGLVVPFVGLAHATYGYGMTVIVLAACRSSPRRCPPRAAVAATTPPGRRARERHRYRAFSGHRHQPARACAEGRGPLGHPYGVRPALHRRAAGGDRAAHRVLDSDAMGYWESPPLKARIARHYAETYGVEVHPEQFILTCGASPALVLALSSSVRARRPGGAGAAGLCRLSQYAEGAASWRRWRSPAAPRPASS